MLQKEGTIVPFYDTDKYDNIKTTDDLKTTPLVLSVLLGRKTELAVGNVLIEAGDEQEFYEIRAQHGSIVFKQ